MKKIIFLYVILVSLLVVGCKRENPKQDNQQGNQGENQGGGTAQVPNPEDMILDPMAWQEKYPMIYESFMRTSRMADDKIEDSDLGGSHPIDYLKKYPNIKLLYEGVGFAKEYYIARGHYYALEDVINITRPKPGASCLACKSAEYERLLVEYGEDMFAMNFDEVAGEVEFGISCYNCHRNTPGEGIQTPSPHFNVAVQTLGMDLQPGTKACAQCHVEYYFDNESKAVVLPWDKGLGVDQMEAYYEEINHADWIHPRTGTPLIKIQHPEFEMYTGSVHDAMKVTCADCHMPYVTEEGTLYKSHWAASPLKNVEEACGKCHAVEGLVERVETSQQEIENIEVEISDMLVKLIVDLEEAIKNEKLDEATLNNLRDLHRKAQYRWDFVFVENSTGFHNLKKARATLDDAKTLAQEALTILEGLE